MKIYQLHLWNDGDGSRGYVYGTSKREVREKAKDFFAGEKIPEPYVIELSSRTKRAIVELLEDFGSHPNNG